MSSKSKTMENSVRAYLPPLYSRLVKCNAKYNGESESEIVVTAVKKHFNEMPREEKERILQYGKED